MLDESASEQERIERAQELCSSNHVVSAATILRAARLEPEWLVPGLLPARDLTLITGAPGAMKSWLAYDLVRAVAQCTSWLGQPVAGSTRRSACQALVLNYDNSRAECGRRFLRLGLLESDPVGFHSLDVGMPLRLPAAQHDLSALVDYLSPRLVLIDTLRQANTAEENSSKEMMVVMAAMKRLYACGAAVVVVHHSGKSPGELSKSRGSQEIDGSTTAVIHVDTERHTPRATWVKHRSWPMPAAESVKYFSVADEADRTYVRLAEKPQKRERAEV